MTLEGLKANNPKVKIHCVKDEAFAPYGRLITDIDYSDIITYMEQKTPIPDGTAYVPSIEALEETACAVEISEKVFGGMNIQVGYCNGKNVALDALEYHKGNENIVAVSDILLMLGRVQDIEAFARYDAAKVEMFFVPKGTALELYGTTLHYAPCAVSAEGFRAVIILPSGTNFPLPFDAPKDGEASLLTAVNKWLIAHPDAKIDGAVAGIYGDNWTLQ